MMFSTPVQMVTVLVIMGLGISGQPISMNTIRDAENYLYKLGYLPSSVNNLAYSSPRYIWTDAIKSFQQTGGLRVTGYLDDDTLEFMNQPRCGFKDIEGSGNRYTFLGGPFNVKDLTYKISKYPQRLSKADTDREVSRAFALWSEYTDLTFTQINSGHANIVISFVQGYHGDADPFDGPGRILGHAYSSYYGKSQAHFDDSENWTINTNYGINLFLVAAHEFGHSLGIGHSKVKKALMFDQYTGYIPNFHLHPDDISAIQALYGKKTYTKSRPSYYPPRKPSTPKPVPDYDQEYSSEDSSEKNTPKSKPTSRPSYHPPRKPSTPEPVPDYGQEYSSEDSSEKDDQDFPREDSSETIEYADESSDHQDGSPEYYIYY